MKAVVGNPNPAYVGQIISGQVQGKFDPGSIDGGGGGPTFVVYNWSTAGVWYSQDGTAGTFEPYGGNGIVSWQQGQADTTFRAQFFAPGQYLLEVSCVATVYSSSNGSVVATFTGTGYIGGSASDIDTSGGAGQAHKAQGKGAHALKAHAGGGDGITVVPAIVTFSDNSLIKLGLGSPQGYLKEITATVTPANQVGSVSFGASNGEVSVGIASSSPDPSTGNVILGIRAVSATPGSTGGSSDCSVTATVSNSLGLPPAASVPVIVYTPKSIGTPHDPATTTTYTITPKPLFFTNQSTPPLTNTVDANGIPIPTGYGVCGWTYFEPTKIIVWDQFNNPLDQIYNGAPVFEDGSPINQKISNGSYTDLVGDILLPYGETILSPSDKRVADFENSNPIPLQSAEPVISNYDISINGIKLSPGIVGRSTQDIAPNRMTISWP